MGSFGARIMPMTLGAEGGTATGERAAAGAEFNIAGWPIPGAGFATGTFLGTCVETSVAARAGLGAAAAWIVGTFRPGTSTDEDCAPGNVGTLRGGAEAAFCAAGITGGGGPAAC
jgi:hypothetical protein